MAASIQPTERKTVDCQQKQQLKQEKKKTTRRITVCCIRMREFIFICGCALEHTLIQRLTRLIRALSHFHFRQKPLQNQKRHTENGELCSLNTVESGNE